VLIESGAQAVREAPSFAVHDPEAPGTPPGDHVSDLTSKPAPTEAPFHDQNPKIHSRNDTLETMGNSASHSVKFACFFDVYIPQLTSDSRNGRV